MTGKTYRLVPRVLFAGIFSALIVSVGSAVAQPTMTATNGAVLSTPRIETMGCLAMGNLLLEFSSSDYRGPEGVPEGHADRRLFEYENELATIYYLQCQAGRSHFQDSSSAFTNGFD